MYVYNFQQHLPSPCLVFCLALPLFSFCPLLSLVAGVSPTPVLTSSSSVVCSF